MFLGVGGSSWGCIPLLQSLRPACLRAEPDTNAAGVPVLDKHLIKHALDSPSNWASEFSSGPREKEGKGFPRSLTDRDVPRAPATIHRSSHHSASTFRTSGVSTSLYSPFKEVRGSRCLGQDWPSLALARCYSALILPDIRYIGRHLTARWTGCVWFSSVRFALKIVAERFGEERRVSVAGTIGTCYQKIDGR